MSDKQPDPKDPFKDLELRTIENSEDACYF